MEMSRALQGRGTEDNAIPMGIQIALVRIEDNDHWTVLLDHWKCFDALIPNLDAGPISNLTGWKGPANAMERLNCHKVVILILLVVVAVAER